MRPLGYAVACLLIGTVFALGLAAWQHRQPAADGNGGNAAASSPAASSSDDGVRIHFEDVAGAAGIPFKHIDGRSAKNYYPEVMGGGAAWLDYDQDGYLDLFLVQGGPFPPEDGKPSTAPTSRLYRNQGDGTFQDVTERVGLLHPGYGQGVAIGDYDNDGYPDLFLTCFGHCHLFHNESDGHGGRRFRDVTKEAGLNLDGWCTSCAFGDIHGKGYLDLFVCRYLTLDFAHYPVCHEPGSKPPVPILCGPYMFPGTSSVLFRNNGNGTFTNVSNEAGLEKDSKALGVVILDLDGDGKSDIFVGNDEVPNHQYRNLGNGKLQSCGVESGTAANWQGTPVGSMGVEADDVTGNGRPDLFVTTFYHQSWLLLRNNGNNFFTDISQSCGMYAPSWNLVGWGTCFLDADRDGDLDVFVANGHVYRNALQMTKSEDGTPQTFAQPAQLFRGDGKGYFKDISLTCGSYFEQPHVGRGVAMADYDNDGAMDLVINHCGDAASLLHNETQTPYHWIRLQLEGSRHSDPRGSNRDAIGARVTLQAGGRRIVRHVKGGGSYLSSSDRRLLIGLGAADKVEGVEVRWPNAEATVQRFGSLAADQSYKLIEGQQQAVPALCPPPRIRDSRRHSIPGPRTSIALLDNSLVREVVPCPGLLGVPRHQ
jgi:hypothetical protein